MSGNDTDNTPSTAEGQSDSTGLVMCGDCNGKGIQTHCYYEGIGWANSYCTCKTGVTKMVDEGSLPHKLGNTTSPQTKCGCYYCLSNFNFSEVEDFVDLGKTALCPICGIDSVAADITDADSLNVLHQRFFDT